MKLRSRFFCFDQKIISAEKGVPVKLLGGLGTQAIYDLDSLWSKLKITSVIDNLLKGASGQAIQNMNLMFGFDETEGIVLKSSGF